MNPRILTHDYHKIPLAVTAKGGGERSRCSCGTYYALYQSCYNSSKLIRCPKCRKVIDLSAVRCPFCGKLYANQDSFRDHLPCAAPYDHNDHRYIRSRLVVRRKSNTKQSKRTAQGATA